MNSARPRPGRYYPHALDLPPCSHIQYPHSIISAMTILGPRSAFFLPPPGHERPYDLGSASITAEKMPKSHLRAYLLDAWEERVAIGSSYFAIVLSVSMCISTGDLNGELRLVRLKASRASQALTVPL